MSTSVEQERKENPFLAFPTLVTGDQRRFTLRFNPTSGEIFVPRQMEYQTLRSLEAAIRQQKHILGKDYLGDEERRIRDVWAWLEFQFQATFGVEYLAFKAFNPLVEQTLSLLSTNRLRLKRDDKDDARQSSVLIDFLRKAARLDGRERCGSRWVKPQTRRVFFTEIKNKISSYLASLAEQQHTSFFKILLLGREFIRTMIGGTVEDLEWINIALGPATRGGEAVEFLGDTAKSLAIVKVLPYLPVVRIAAINLIGCREEFRERNRGIIGDKTSGTLFTQKSVIELIEEGNIDEAKNRIRRLSLNPLKKVLEDTNLN